jgi:nucleoside-diphosphate-sugar epimerase
MFYKIMAIHYQLEFNMSEELHVVLGARGVSGLAVIEELRNRNLNIRGVARSGTTSVTTLNADLLDRTSTEKATQGASHVYLCAGLEYSSKVWAREWPIVMDNVIYACEKSQSKLIFLDNIYMYGPVPLSVPFDESHPRSPSSQKGKVRKLISEMVLQANKQGRIKAIIARSADFYGPNVTNCALYPSLIENIVKNKNPQSIGKLNVKHTYAYIPDLGKALVLLGLEESCYGEVWHLPVSESLTISEIIILINKILKTNFEVSYVPSILRKTLSLFISPLRELNEMMYQFEYDYVMSYDKFQKKFPKFKATQMEEGLRNTLTSFQK